MARVTIDETTLTAIGGAIRAKLSVSTEYKPSQMPSAIRSIVTPVQKVLDVTQNGTYVPSGGWNGFREVNVDVPNEFDASDEGKVVSNGALVAQTSTEKTANGTYDTTLNDEVVVNVTPTLQTKSATQNGTIQPDSGYDGLSSVEVNVPNTYGASDEGKVVSSGALVSQTSATKTENGTYDTTLNNEIVVNVPQGVTPTGNINITDTQVTDVSAYATAQVVDTDLVAGNIKKDVDILGVIGTYEGSGGGSTLVTKTITENGTYDPADDNADGYSEVTVNVSGGGYSLSYDVGEFIGIPAGNTGETLIGTVTGKANTKILLVVMHRDTITTPAGFTLVNKTRNTNYEQYISIFEKESLTNETLTVTIQQSSAVRICACWFRISRGFTVGQPTLQEMDYSSASYHLQYTISANSAPRLIVLSNATVSSNYTSHSQTSPRQNSLPNEAVSNEGTRLAAFIQQSASDVVWTDPNTTVDENSYTNNRALIYPFI